MSRTFMVPLDLSTAFILILFFLLFSFEDLRKVSWRRIVQSLNVLTYCVKLTISNPLLNDWAIMQCKLFRSLIYYTCTNFWNELCFVLVSHLGIMSLIGCKFLALWELIINIGYTHKWIFTKIDNAVLFLYIWAKLTALIGTKISYWAMRVPVN